MSLAEDFRDAVRVDDHGHLSYEDSERADRLEDGLPPMDPGEAEHMLGDLDGARELIDERIGHECVACAKTVMGWCPMEGEPHVCPSCLRRDAEDYEEAQERGKVREYRAYLRRERL